MDEYEYQRQQQLAAEYERLRHQYEAELIRNEQLEIDVAGCQYDVASSIDIISDLNRAVLPPLSETAAETDKKQVIAENVHRTLDDLEESYKLLKNGSTATKNLTADYDDYYTHYGLYNELRQVSLGYVVGLDANLWQSDVPRQKVEKMYLANTEYWLAYAVMAVMLWSSDEEEACQRAVSKSMQINERKSALFFLLASLRFNRIEAAKQWYGVYFDLVEASGIGEEIVYILQVLLCGALGADLQFGKTVQNRMRELMSESKDNISERKAAQERIDSYFNTYISVTKKEFIALKHICPEYEDMMKLLSSAEKNAELKAYFESVLSENAPLSDRLSERIEDALYALIASNDDAEQELLDKIQYEEMVVKANGDLKVAQESYDAYLKDRAKAHNLSLIMVNTALDKKSTADKRVKQFALDFMRKEVVAGAQKYSAYRKKEKAQYDFVIDGCNLHGDENSFEANKPKLLEHYENRIKAAIKASKPVQTLKKISIVACIGFVLFAVLAVVGFVAKWKTGAPVSFLVLAVLAAGAFAACLYFAHDERIKVRKNFQYRIDNGIKMLKEGLEDLAKWRQSYKEADSVFEQLLNVLKEVRTNG